MEEVHRIFKLGDMHVAGFVDGLSATADNGRVSSDAFLRYMCGLAGVRTMRVGTHEAVSVAGKIFNLFDEEKQQEVELRVLASGLSVRGRLSLAGFAANTLPTRAMRVQQAKGMDRYSSPNCFLRCSPKLADALQGVLEGPSGMLVQPSRYGEPRIPHARRYADLLLRDV